MPQSGVSEQRPVVFIVDDDALLRAGIERLCRSAGMEVHGFGSAAEFLRAARLDVPACLVLDIHLPGASGLELQRELLAREAVVSIVFMTGYADIPTSVRAIKAGAVEFLVKPFSDSELLAAIEQAMVRARGAHRDRIEVHALRARLEALTPRERQVMELVVEGQLNKQIASRLGICEVTVKSHRAHVMRKTRADSLPDLVRLVERAGRRVHKP